MRLRCTTDADFNACRASFSFERVCNCAKTSDNQCSTQFHTGSFHDRMNHRTSVKQLPSMLSVKCLCNVILVCANHLSNERDWSRKLM